jgi:type II secretory pathway component PulC
VVVEPNSVGGCRLRPGDIIMAVNRRRARSVNELMVGFREETNLSISLLRGDYRITILIR